MRQQSNPVKSKYLPYRPFCLKYIFPIDCGKGPAPKSNVPTTFLGNPPWFSDLFIRVARKLSPRAAAAEEELAQYTTTTRNLPFPTLTTPADEEEMQCWAGAGEKLPSAEETSCEF